MSNPMEYDGHDTMDMEALMGMLPKNRKLEDGYDEKLIRNRDYRNWTVADLSDLIRDLPDNAAVFISRYDEAEDDIFLRPVEGFYSSIDGKHSYVTIG